jgi:hypothetical protein
VLGNLPWFLEQAKKDGLIEFYDADEEDWEEEEDEDE